MTYGIGERVPQKDRHFGVDVTRCPYCKEKGRESMVRYPDTPPDLILCPHCKTFFSGDRYYYVLPGPAERIEIYSPGP